MKKIIFIILLLISNPLISSPAWATDYFAAPTVAGAENCLTSVANAGLIATSQFCPARPDKALPALAVL